MGGFQICEKVQLLSLIGCTSSEGVLVVLMELLLSLEASPSTGMPAMPLPRQGQPVYTLVTSILGFCNALYVGLIFGLLHKLQQVQNPSHLQKHGSRVIYIYLGIYPTDLS